VVVGKGIRDGDGKERTLLKEKEKGKREEKRERK